MKSFRFSTLFIGTLALTFSSCEKNAENNHPVSENKAVTTSKVVYPLIGTDMSDNILPMRKLPRAVVTKGDSYSEINVKLIDTICPDYLRETKRLDLTYLKEGAVVATIRNDDITITAEPEFHNIGFARLSGGSNGWWTHWNYLPYTESEHPIVLFAQDRRGSGVSAWSTIDISLNKYVKTFGFEIAPNATGKDYKVVVTYREYPTYRAQSLFDVEQTISSPSGARLIAVKSDVSFDFISIDVQGAYDEDAGFAIANIRYALGD